MGRAKIIGRSRGRLNATFSIDTGSDSSGLTAVIVFIYAISTNPPRAAMVLKESPGQGLPAHIDST